MIQKQTTLGQSEIVARKKIPNISTLKCRKSPKLTNKKHAKYDLNLFKKSTDTGISPEVEAKYSDLIDYFFDVFSKNDWYIGQCDVNAHDIPVEPGSRRIEIPKPMPLH